jgi:hypothetical protein
MLDYSDNMACTGCLRQIPDDSLFCPYCGNPTAQGKAEQTQAVAHAVATPSPATGKCLSGLGGWLSLVGLGLLVSPFILLYETLWVTAPFLYRGNYPNTAFAVVAAYELLIGVAMLVALVYLNILFFKKKNCLPALFHNLFLFLFCP